MSRMFSFTLSLSLVSVVFFQSPLAEAQRRGATSRAAPNDGLKLYSMEELYWFEDSMRTRYIKALRRAALDLEDIQNAFDKAHAYGMYSRSFEEYASINPLLRVLMGQHAYAQTNRGRNAGDQCIYGGVLSQYAGPEPFRCEPIPCDNNQSGIKCGFTYSGLSGKMACLNTGDATRATRNCGALREDLARQNQEPIRQTVKRANDYFFNVVDFDPSNFDSSAAQSHIQQLINSAYSDDAYSLLIKVAAFYKMNGKEFPQALRQGAGRGVGEAASSVQNIESLHNAMTETAENLFRAHRDHCRQPLSPQVVQELKDGTHLRSDRVSEAGKRLERKRIEALNALPEGTTPTHENVLEIEECRYVLSRLQALEAVVDEVDGSGPIVRRTPDGNALPDRMPEPLPDLPDPRDTEVTPTGCSENVTRQNSLLAHTSARCLVCPIQRNEVNKGNSTYNPSRKWLSLLSTMATACGDAATNQTTVTTETMLRYWSTFGHCSADVYEWTDDEYSGGRAVHDFVEKWATDGRHWEISASDRRDRDLPDPDKDKQFASVYGISMRESIKLFCDPDQFKNLNSSRKPPRRRPGYEHQVGEDWVQTRREAFNQNIEVRPGRNAESNAKMLYDCIQEARRKNQQFQSVNVCSSTFEQAQSSRNLQEKFNDGAILSEGASCHVPLQTERTRTQTRPSGVRTACRPDEDGKDIETGQACDEEDVAYSFISPGRASLSQSGSRGELLTSLRRYRVGDRNDYPNFHIFSRGGSSLNRTESPDNYRLAYLHEGRCPDPRYQRTTDPATQRPGERIPLRRTQSVDE